MKLKAKTYLLLTVVLIFGCSAEGDIEVHNRTGAQLNIEIDGDRYELEAYEHAKKSYTFSNALFSPDEEKDVNVSGEGLVKWEFDQEYTVKANETEKVNIYADAGAIQITNNSSFTIIAVYLAPSSDPNWGENDLHGYIYPGETCSWRVCPGYWDIKVVDTRGYYATSYDYYIGMGDVCSLTYGSLCKNQENSPSKNKENFLYSEPIVDRIEKYNH